MYYTIFVVEDEKRSRTLIIELLKKIGISKIITFTYG